MQKLALSALLYLLLSMLAGCAHLGDERGVFIDDALVFNFLSPASFGQELILTQAVTLRFGEETHDLLFYTEITANTVSMAGLLPNGTRLFSIVYDGESLASNGSAELLSRVDPGYLLADMQIAQWPFAVVRSSFELANRCFKQGTCSLTETPDQRQRKLSRNNQPLISIHYDGVPQYQSTLNYEHHARQYQLQVETLDIQSPPRATP